MNRNLLLRHLYTTTSGKYLKFKIRLDKALQSGRFYKFSKKKQSSLIGRLKRLFERLKSLRTQLRLAGAGAAFALSFSLSTEIQAQNLGPFEVNDAANPLPPPVIINRPKAAVVDIDNDGDLDVFVGNYDGYIEFFRNNNGLNPASLKRFVKQEGVDNPLDGVNKGYYAAPAFADVDKDGDFDMLLGAGYGDTFFFRNTGTKSSPIFTEETGSANPFNGIRGSGGASKYNYGYSPAVPIFVQIDGNADVDLFMASSFTSFNDPEFGFYSFPAVKYYQNDGTAVPGVSDAAFNYNSNLLADELTNFNNVSLAFADIDGDGDLDAFVGSNSYRLRLFRNDGSSFNQDNAPWDPVGKTGNPMNNFDFNNFSSPVAADFDGDGDLDLLVAEFFDEGDWEDHNTNLRYFENTAGDSSPEVTDFVYVEKSDLNISPFGGVDVFEEAKPVFVDLDNDNDLDVVIGHKYNYTSELFVYINQNGEYVADPEHPLVSIINDNEETNAPVFIDIDGDKDLDLFLARNFKIEFFRNIGTDKKVEDFQLESNLFPSLTNGTANRLSAAFLDVDNDGDFDALISNDRYTSHIEYFENQGTAQVPDFVSATLPAPFDTFGNVPSGTNLSASDMDQDGDMDIIFSFSFKYSSSSTYFTRFENLGNGTFSPDAQPIINNSYYSSSYVPGGSVATFVDIDGDGDLDGIIGNGFYNYDYYEAGTITYFENTNPAPVTLLATTLNFAQQSTPIVLDASISVSDADDDLISTAVISIANFKVGQEVLSFTPQGGITRSFDAATGILTLTGKAAVSVYSAALKTVSYQFIGPNPTTSGRLASVNSSAAITLSRSISVRVFDQDFTYPVAKVMALEISFPDPPPTEIIIFNGISPNGDGLNDFFELRNIGILEPANKVSIYTRWGDKVYEVENYDNDQKKFIGLNENGNELTSGVYFYKVKFASGKEDVTGYLTIKR